MINEMRDLSTNSFSHGGPDPSSSEQNRGFSVRLLRGFLAKRGLEALSGLGQECRRGFGRMCGAVAERLKAAVC